MRFHYIASQSSGKVIEGEFEARGSAEVLEYLATQGLRPISLGVVKKVEEIKQGLFFKGTITTSDKVFLTKYLALMLKVGTDLFRAIDILIADLDSPTMKALLTEIRGNLEKGLPFHITFTKYPNYFSPVFINLIKAGESSGNLEQVFENLSASLEKEQGFKRTIKAALTYPIILLILSSLILFFLVSFALPKIAEIFSTSGFKPPLFSRIVFTVGLFVGGYKWYFLGGALALIPVFWYLFTKSLTTKRMLNKLATKIPLIRNVLKEIALQRFASTLSSLLKAGLPILESLEITAQAVGSEEIGNSLMRVSREGIAKGLTIGEAFRRESAFPGVVVNLMSISEKAGHIEDVLSTLASFYESEVEITINTMMRFLEPILLMVMGAIIGLIALSIIVPIYQLVGQF